MSATSVVSGVEMPADGVPLADGDDEPFAEAAIWTKQPQASSASSSVNACGGWADTAGANEGADAALLVCVACPVASTARGEGGMCGVCWGAPAAVAAATVVPASGTNLKMPARTKPQCGLEDILSPVLRLMKQRRPTRAPFVQSSYSAQVVVL